MSRRRCASHAGKSSCPGWAPAGMNRRLSASGPSSGPGASASRQGRSRSRDVSNTGGTPSACLAGPMSAPDSVPDSVPDPMTDIMVVNNEAGHRYEVWLGQARASFTQYTLDDRLEDTLDDIRRVGLITF